MDLAFVLRGIVGKVSVSCRANDHPELVGSGADSQGFPLCHAVVDYPAQGYDAVLGWVQLVRSDDNVTGSLSVALIVARGSVGSVTSRLRQ